MALDANSRAEISRKFQQNLSKRRESVSITSVQLDAVIQSNDDYLVITSAARNASIPMPQRALLTDDQKNELWADTSEEKFKVGD